MLKNPEKNIFHTCQVVKRCSYVTGWHFAVRVPFDVVYITQQPANKRLPNMNLIFHRYCNVNWTKQKMPPQTQAAVTYFALDLELGITDFIKAKAFGKDPR